ncbi:hypothetical protein AVEN_166194-1 [Araneus ventricosus]|uniref:Uncharacterized protein n=1 Tax=Araneus ventricosus TaxID=182803 RepID=A0A4Y2DDA1_ARAVE|nr:hypothetical protein AVEN_166194-1 [Araneus ventricosus]
MHAILLVVASFFQLENPKPRFQHRTGSLAVIFTPCHSQANPQTLTLSRGMGELGVVLKKKMQGMPKKSSPSRKNGRRSLLQLQTLLNSMPCRCQANLLMPEGLLTKVLICHCSYFHRS